MRWITMLMALAAGLLVAACASQAAQRKVPPDTQPHYMNQATTPPPIETNGKINY